jgi:hypothetical protein
LKDAIAHSQKATAASQSKLQVEIVPMGPSGFLGKIIVNDAMISQYSQASKFATIVILDQSGSMGDWVQRVIRELLPKVFDGLEYNPEEVVYLLPFDNRCRIIEMKVCDFSGCKNIGPGGGTYMVPVMCKLEHLLDSFENSDNAVSGVRILTVSDGAVFDQIQTKERADALTSKYKDTFKFNSQAVQIFSSNYASPDTTALCSLLQLSNTATPRITNIFKKHELNIPAIVGAFAGDGVDFALKLQSENGDLLWGKKNLWDVEYTDSIGLRAGENLFWINPILVDSLTSGKKRLRFHSDILAAVSLSEPVTELSTASALMDRQLASICDHLKILRLIDSQTSQQQMQNIIEKYRQLESQILSTSADTDGPSILANDMSSRLVHLRQTLKKRAAGFATKMAQIANDDTIDALNSAQKADYLRATVHSKTSRGLAKRATAHTAGGLNFDSIAREEVRQIAKNITKLQDIDEDKDSHQCSFYSMETTVGALRALAQLPDMDGFDQITATDILLLFNIVGIACEGPIGDFPDPMTWRATAIYPGTFVSIADILTAQVQCPGKNHLLVPGGQKDSVITSVIPLFEDKRITLFIRKWAPCLLSYTCSIGMRRMIAHIPMTDGYTLCAGIWKLVEHVSQNPSELNVRTFKHLCNSYNLFAGEYFARVRPCLLADSQFENNTAKSFYIQNNGLTNLIAPLFYHFKNNNNNYNHQDIIKFKQNLPAILRALFAYESWQMIRREFKGEESVDKIENFLTQLLGIDLDKHAYKFPELFNTNTPHRSEIAFYDEPNFNYSAMKQIIAQKGYYLKYIAIIGLLLQDAASDKLNTTNYASLLEDETFVCKQFGLPSGYRLDDFLILSIIQGLLFPTTKERTNKETEEMLFDDLINPESTLILIRDHIRNRFINRYEQDRVVRIKTEREILLNEFLSAITNCTNRNQLIALFKTGVSRNVIYNYSYKGPNSYGTPELKSLLTNISIPFPLRKDAITFFLHATDPETGDVLFNHGRSGMVENIDAFEWAFLSAGGSKEEWSQVFQIYKVNSVHCYRDGKCNRHGHHNGKPSYWALGFMTLEKFAKNCTTEEFKEYCAIHFDCCGVDQLDLGIKKKQ